MESAEVRDTQVRNLIGKLVDFLGPTRVQDQVTRYERSLLTAGPIFAEHYLRHKHPWWDAISQYYQLDRAAKSVRRNLTPGIKSLAVQARKMMDLAHSMPSAIKAKYRGNLLSDENAYAYLFEIEMAWHFRARGCSIQWSEAPKGRHAEFLVRCPEPECEFNVECKRITVDASRKIRRQDFYAFVEKIVGRPNFKGYTGDIVITLADRLPRRNDLLDRLVAEVTSIVDGDQVTGTHPTASGSLSLNLRACSGAVVDLPIMYTDLWATLPPHARGVIIPRSNGHQPIDPLRIILALEKADSVLEGIRRTLSETSRDQLERSRPGFIACFLEGVDNLAELRGDTGLRRMTHSLFESDSRSHIAAIGYHGEMLTRRGPCDEVLFSQGLVFPNPRCKFTSMKDFKFLSPLYGT